MDSNQEVQFGVRTMRPAGGQRPASLSAAQGLAVRRNSFGGLSYTHLLFLILSPRSWNSPEVGSPHEPGSRHLRGKVPRERSPHREGKVVATVRQTRLRNNMIYY
jgi:hypothetical protein